MKKVFLVLSFLLGTTALFAQTGDKKPPITITVHFELHRPARDCQRGFGLCNGNIDVTIGRSFLAEATLDGTKLTISFLEAIKADTSFANEDLSTLIISDSEEYSFNKAITDAYGVASLKALAGNYVVDYSTNSFGVVVLNVQ